MIIQLMDFFLASQVQLRLECRSMAMDSLQTPNHLLISTNLSIYTHKSPCKKNNQTGVGEY